MRTLGLAKLPDYLSYRVHELRKPLVTWEIKLAPIYVVYMVFR